MYFVLLFISVSKIVVGESVVAFPADSFVESIGVNTHWSVGNVYTKNYTGLKLKLAEAGIRYMRDGGAPSIFERANDLYSSLGIKLDIITEKRKPGSWPQPLDPSQIADELNRIKSQVLSATVSIEAPNEYDLTHGDDPYWIENIRNYSIVLYNVARADRAFENISLIGPSLTTLSAYGNVSSLDQYIDYPNLHLYQWNFWPGFNGYDDNGSSPSITWYLNDLARQQSPSGKRVQTTEAGYCNDIHAGGLSEDADGKYTARILVEFFRRGIYRTYKYELIDEALPGREGTFGLLRNDLSEKPAFRVVKNLIGMLNDRGPEFQPDSLNYTLNGSMSDVRQILFQKRNHDFYLMLWIETSSWNLSALIDRYPPPQQVVLTLQDSKSISNATLFAFNNSSYIDMYELHIDNNQITLNISDKMSIIKLQK